MTGPKVEAVSVTRLGWGESACWDDNSQRTYFVDCIGREVGAYDLRIGGETSRIAVASLPTALYLTTETDRLLVQLDDGLHAIAVGSIGTSLVVPAPSSGHRFNDGIVERSGCILTGSLIFGASSAVSSGSYWRYSPTAGWRKLHEGKGNTNGPCISPDGAHLYIADSGAGLIYRFSYGPSGELGDEVVFADVRHLGGIPDGATIDADGCLWTTIFGGSCIAQFTPAGRLERIVDVPASHPTSVTFAGRQLDELWVTTIGAREFGVEPKGSLSGALLRIEGLGACGLARSRCPF
jgi:sugar lactone lactonase YvrE